MYGIHLIIDKKKKLISSSFIRSMMLPVAHRGPDAESFLLQEGELQNTWIAGNRLKIIDTDPAASDQPMISPCGRYSLVFNGEVYNYHDLRNQLLSEGEQFKTRSATEVLLKLLIKNRKDALSLLNGMFAFAFYDRQQEALLAATDPFGMKPLYYYEDEQYLILSSATKSILASGLMNKRLNEQQIYHYLRFKYALPSGTFFRDIFALQPGSFLEKYNGHPVKITSFLPAKHQEQPPKQILTDETAVIKETEVLLADAVLRHLSADAPCGLFLSGDVNSTLLLAIIKREGAHPVPTFSIINEKKDQSFGTKDYYYTAKAADLFGSYHYELALQPELVENAWIDFLDKTDQPVADSTSLITYLLSQQARKITGVVLSGAGADELFGGYNRHKAFQWYLQHYSFLQKSGSMLKFSKHLPTGFPHPWRKQFRLLKKLGRNLHRNPLRTYQNLVSLDMPFGTSQNTPVETALPLNQTFNEGSIEEYLLYALEYDLHHYLPFDVLSINDNMSMAQGMEMRMPYLDSELTGFTRQLPATLRLKHGTKWILKQILNSYGGSIFSNRYKKGFNLPTGVWLRRKEYSFLRQPLENPESMLFQFIPYPRVQHMLQAHIMHKTDNSQELWALLMLSAWLSHHFN